VDYALARFEPNRGIPYSGAAYAAGRKPRHSEWFDKLPAGWQRLVVAADLKPWKITAVNLPEHASNPIHTDAGARAGGFPAALVAGVTVYAYLTHPVVAADPEWVVSGSGEVRFRSPVFDGDHVDLAVEGSTSTGSVSTFVHSGPTPDAARASLKLFPSVEFDAGDQAPEALTDQEFVLTGQWGDYGTRAGDDLDLYLQGVIHPATWPGLANHLFHHQLARGGWVHTRTRFQHHAVAMHGDRVLVHAEVIRRFTKLSGERAVARVSISRDGQPIATLEHEAIISLP
jgi:acyl dehydratase